MSVLGEWEAQPLFSSRACSERLPSSEALKERVAREGFEVVIISGKRVHQSKRIPPITLSFRRQTRVFLGLMFDGLLVQVLLRRLARVSSCNCYCK